MQWSTYKNEISSIYLLNLIFILFIYQTSGNRGTPLPYMCLGDDKDCSFQFPITHRNSCLIYETKACMTNDFPDWSLKPLTKPTSESDSEFVVSILPYEVHVDEVQFVPVSAINISLTILNKDISGFSIIMTNGARNICRILDFRNSLGSFNIPLTVFYDCLHNLVEDGLKNSVMSFKAYPLNMEVSYLLYLPLQPSSYSQPPCNWMPLVMIFRGSLSKEYIQMKFSNAPEELSVTFFNLTLFDSSDAEIQKIRIPFNAKNDLIANDFSAVEGGFYSVSISIMTAKESCIVFKSPLLLVGEEPKDYSFIIFIILLIIMITSGSALVYFSCRWYLKTAGSFSKPTILLVHLYKQHEQEELTKFCRELENCYGVKVSTIYKSSGHPGVSLQAKYSEADVIVIVISEGLYNVIEHNNSSEGDHPWRYQVPETVALINDTRVGKKKICKIGLSFSSKGLIPKCLELRGEFFMWPNDKDKFLCFIHGCSKKLYLLNKLCCEIHHKVSSSSFKLNEGKIDEESRNIKESKLDALPVVRFENMLKCNISECEKQPYYLEENCHVSAAHFLSKEGAENVMSLRQKPDLTENENDDCVLYLVRKILTSE